MSALFTIRDARPDDMDAINAYAANEGMDELPSWREIRVAVDADDAVVGFLRLQRGEDGTAHVNPMVTYPTWRGHGVGRALLADAQERAGELRLVARGWSAGFYYAVGFADAEWEDIDEAVARQCDGCPMFDECGPLPMRRADEGGGALFDAAATSPLHRADEDVG